MSFTAESKPPVSSISSSINSQVTVLPSRLLQSSLTPTKVESYVQITRSVEPTFVQFSSIIQPSKVESSAYHSSSTVSNSATLENTSNDEIKLPTSNEKLSENSNDDSNINNNTSEEGIENNAEINGDNAKESNQNNEEIKVVIVEPVFVRDEETNVDKESISNSGAAEELAENNVENTNSETNNE